MSLTTYVEAIRQGIWEEMEKDERVFVLGEDVGIYGGAFKVTAGMLERFGEWRIIDTPISESGIVGAAIGGVGIAGMVGGLGWHFAERPQRIILVRPAVGAGYGGLTLSSHF